MAGHLPKAAYKPIENNKENNLKYFIPGKAHNNSSKRPHSLSIIYQTGNRMLVNGSKVEKSNDYFV